METEKNLRACQYALEEHNAMQDHFDNLVKANFDRKGNIKRCKV